MWKEIILGTFESPASQDITQLEAAQAAEQRSSHGSQSTE